MGHDDGCPVGEFCSDQLVDTGLCLSIEAR